MDTEKNICRTCKSTYKTVEIGADCYTCSGVCLKRLAEELGLPTSSSLETVREQWKTKRANKVDTKQRGKSPIKTTSSNKAFLMKPTFSERDCCKAIRPSDGQEREATIVRIKGDEANVVFAGFDDNAIVAIKSLRPSSGKASREAQIAEADKARGNAKPDSNGVPQSETPSSSKWKVGDSCSAIFSEDNTMYEAEISTIDKTEEGREYAIVTFVGYGNQESVWLEDLQSPLKNKEEKEDGQDVTGAKLDNTPLVVLSQRPTTWKAGDHCVAIFTEDSVRYEAEISDILKDEQSGKPYANVVYLGYGNEEVKWFDDLEPSRGPHVRMAQLRAADGKIPQPTIQPIDDNNNSKAEEPVDAPAKAEADETCKEWAVDDKVRAIFSQDGSEYEGVVKSITEDQGKKLALVRFSGYGDEETVEVLALKPSKGKGARQEQRDAAKAMRHSQKTEDGKTAVSSKSSSSTDGSKAKEATSNEEQPTEAKDEKNPEAEAETTEPVEALANGIDEPEKEWQVGDHCRAVFTEDSLEYEGTITLIGDTDDGKYAVVTYLGYGNEESVWFQDLMESNGEEARKEQLKASGTSKEDDAAQERGDENEPQQKCQEMSVSDSNNNAATPVVVEDAGGDGKKDLSDADVGQEPITVDTEAREASDVPNAAGDAPILACNNKLEPIDEEATPIQLSVSQAKSSVSPVDLPDRGLSPDNSSMCVSVIHMEVKEIADLLRQELESAKIIKTLRQQLKESEEEKKDLFGQNTAMNVAIQEMRHTNLRLKDENERLKEIAQSHETITTKLHEDVRTLLDKINALRNEKQGLVTEIVALKSGKL